MPKDTATARETVTLFFQDEQALRHVNDPIHKDLSTATRAGDSLFVSCDETAGVDRLTAVRGGWGDHVHFSLAEIFELPDGPDGEMDIEGLAAEDGWLWICGSHSLKRDKPDAGDGPKKALKAMADIDRDPNRYFLARVPLVREGQGLKPVKKDGKRRAACLKLRKKRSKLKGWLKGDDHLGPFLDLPSKENGLDIEGIAVRGDRVWLGLRGPVLREAGVILEMEMKVTKNGWLKAKRIDGKARYRKHLIDTKGQGIRDLAWDGDDLLILTGTVMAGDGPSEIIRWREAPSVARSGYESTELVVDMPYRGEVDHPEGLVHWPEANGWLVVYDSPAEKRLVGTSVTADVMRF